MNTEYDLIEFLTTMEVFKVKGSFIMEYFDLCFDIEEDSQSYVMINHNVRVKDGVYELISKKIRFRLETDFALGIFTLEFRDYHKNIVGKTTVNYIGDNTFKINYIYRGPERILKKGEHIYETEVVEISRTKRANKI